MTKGKKNDCERTEGGRTVRIRNGNKVYKGRKFETRIRKGRKKAKWNKARRE